MCVCVTYIYSHAEVMPVACGTDILDVIRAWLELLMGRVFESKREADCRIHSHIEVSHMVFLQTVVVSDTESDAALDFFALRSV